MHLCVIFSNNLLYVQDFSHCLSLPFVFVLCLDGNDIIFHCYYRCRKNSFLVMKNKMLNVFPDGMHHQGLLQTLCHVNKSEITILYCYGKYFGMYSKGEIEKYKYS